LAEVEAVLVEIMAMLVAVVLGLWLWVGFHLQQL
jgi:hypothetical protein